PQMVALFNGVGGGAAALIATSDYVSGGGGAGIVIPIVLSAVIGSISFAGSMIAFVKLQEWMTGRPVTYPGQQLVNGLITVAILGLAVFLVATSLNVPLFVTMAVLALVLGVAFVLPIGGADMPVVISLLNAFTGLAAAATGFVLGNTVLIVAGALVGASGTLLTLLMSKAMGRSIANVLFSAFGSAPAGGAAGAESAGGSVRSGSADDVAVLLAYAQSVVIVPGYGLAVAQAQHAVRELAELLEKRGIDVKYAIHPVAGRMPGHMNVLLAEANVPYEQLYEMEQINPQLERTDVALVVGANDTTNPAAKDTPSSPIYGMPIIEVDRAVNVVVLKRSMASGFAGVDNPLYFNPKTTMFFGDAKKSLSELVTALKNV
ncbi:MAG: NAD(P)(+) transhydrogenase (Re/Si-specific) subunit beta, partial [Candidatus Dormibacteraeota bacterium]|nr:NAD(P)(+) transhydrogenase (Re/Si-specific) subunit beta [Candidatus Dormibacteraeota bacterium]